MNEDFANQLLKNGVVTLDQMKEAKVLNSKGKKIDIGAALVQLDYATSEEIAIQYADFLKNLMNLLYQKMF